MRAPGSAARHPTRRRQRPARRAVSCLPNGPARAAKMCGGAPYCVRYGAPHLLCKQARARAPVAPTVGPQTRAFSVVRNRPLSPAIDTLAPPRTATKSPTVVLLAPPKPDVGAPTLPPLLFPRAGLPGAFATALLTRHGTGRLLHDQRPSIQQPAQCPQRVFARSGHPPPACSPSRGRPAQRPGSPPRRCACPARSYTKSP